MVKKNYIFVSVFKVEDFVEVLHLLNFTKVMFPKVRIKKLTIGQRLNRELLRQFRPCEVTRAIRRVPIRRLLHRPLTLEYGDNKLGERKDKQVFEI